ncbi:hypothetical protein OIO90_000946 [Microbotryomycetes sp. JL221]|nr:hypothetical protein OIO90_000946 [Microbotryomycetes sp. JL221]
MLSIITSLALNLRHSRSEFQTNRQTFETQIQVLQQTIDLLQQQSYQTLTHQEKHLIEKRLHRVGLGHNQFDDSIDETRFKSNLTETSWWEVLLGKRGTMFQQDNDDQDDNKDWDKLFEEADKVETKRQQQAIERIQIQDSVVKATSRPTQSATTSLKQSRPRQDTTPSQPATGVYL